MRFFNTEGPMKPEIHYTIPPLSRWNLDDILTLIARQKYFVVHAPRQTGKTSCLLALQAHLNQSGTYRCLYCNVEVAQAAREDVANAMQAILNDLAVRSGDAWLENLWPDILQRSGAYGAFGTVLTRIAEQSPVPVVLLIDEIDSLVGDTLISMLRQLRGGYDKRPTQFPQSVILCGVRDVRDYRLKTDDGKAAITGGSAFNIKAKSLRLGNFTREELDMLYRQHTDETGQTFEPDALDLLWEFTQGQPWLANALALEVCFELEEGLDRSQPITAAMVETAKEHIVLRRDTHLDQLIDKLREARVRRVIEPILASDDEPGDMPTDDVQYAIDLGLIRPQKPFAISNRIYQEIIPRELIHATEYSITQETAWYVDAATNKLDMNKLLAAFQDFFRQHSEHWLECFAYKEAGPQLLLQAFLQRIVNGGGRVEREYGLGRKRTDLLIIWPHRQGVQKIVLELKLLWNSLEKTLEEGLPQTVEYMDKAATESGHLLVFDRRPGIPWDDKIFAFDRTYHGKTVCVWGC
ncbi:hypothetical protein U14_05132 [Candidatus Moduliflexus flocculans]|uniref:ORC1/DEAH AAA+ ATPase domain-containing protein n=1 Tax=Candidatus Moduliflexus flocculans TaxID=1499966 RepID=A0A081BR27_9BACT|nr:hypothetical protein U14_05132 [Candidatus Moduliflexus flocculans]